MEGALKLQDLVYGKVGKFSRTPIYAQKEIREAHQL